MIVGLVTDFEMTCTGDLSKIAWKNNDFVFKVSIPQRKLANGPLKNSEGPTWLSGKVFDS